jgi:uncharacterized protein YukE
MSRARDPDDRPIRVTPETLAAGSKELAGQSSGIAALRDDYSKALRDIPAKIGGDVGSLLADVHDVWYIALEMMAQTTASVADATQQAAVLYEHVDRTVIPPPPEPPPPPAPPPQRYDPRHPPIA